MPAARALAVLLSVAGPPAPAPASAPAPATTPAPATAPAPAPATATAPGMAPAPPSPRARLAIDLPVAAIAAAGAVGLWIAHPYLARTSCPCTPDDAPRFERFAVGLDWKPGEPLANVTIGLVLAAPLAILPLVAERPALGFADALLVGEAVACAGLVTQVVKVLASRPYPYMYGPAPYPEQNGDGINYAAFWSGHTANAMAAAVAFAYLLERRRAPRAMRLTAWLVGPALAVASGLLELSAGNHFPTDVLAGAAFGVAAGLLVPWLHAL